MKATPSPIEVPDSVLVPMRDRLGAARMPHLFDGDEGWSLGCDRQTLEAVCGYWVEEHDWHLTEDRLNALEPVSHGGVHTFALGMNGGGVPVVCLHGWPSSPLEYLSAAEQIAAAGHPSIAPSLPGFAFSDDPGQPITVPEASRRLRSLLTEGLGLDRYVVAGGDWGAIIAARMVYASSGEISGLYVSTPATLPAPADFDDPAPSEEEIEYAGSAQKWLKRSGHHMILQSIVPDAISPALQDSPAGFAAYLLEKYRRWGDCEGDLFSRFSPEVLCDWLTAQWGPGSIASSMRLYWGEKQDRWRLAKGESLDIPAAVSVWKGEPLLPPRSWTERVLPDLRSWKEMPSGGHFAAFEEPELYSEDLLAFLASLDS
jgi:pimeloyl-ACP methyl ester carboxylesterase